MKLITILFITIALGQYLAIESVDVEHDGLRVVCFIAIITAAVFTLIITAVRLRRPSRNYRDHELNSVIDHARRPNPYIRD